MDKEIKQRYQNLVKEVEEHNRRYYEEDNPIISDYEYDQLTQELRKLENDYPELVTENSPSQKVGGKAREGGVMVKHRVPMLSLLDVFNTDEVKSFVAKTSGENIDYVVEQKIDGLSVSLRYENGKFVQGITRGDGINYGEDITDNLKMISDVLLELKTKVEYLELRGEVYMTFTAFDKANELQEERGERLFKNPRNCAAGTLRQLNPEVVKERNLSMFVFNVQDANGITFKTHSESLEWLRNEGFSIVPQMPTCKNFDEVLKAINEIAKNRNSLNYPIDGAVIKVNDLHERVKLGNTSKVPRWAVAYKYPPEEKQTVVRDIVCQVGRTGRITPLAIMDPVELGGSTVSKATLHNQDHIDKLGIAIGDTVVIRKAADIIPEIVSVIKEKRTTDVEVYKIPSTCPVCGADVEKEEDVADMRCINASCPAQFERLVQHFASRDMMDIQGLGEAATSALIREKLISDIADIYYLKNHRQEMIDKKIVGKEKSTDNLLNAIEKSKSNNIDRLISGFGIRNVGRHVSKILAEHYDSIEEISKASFDDLLQLPDFGETTAKFLVDFFKLESTKELLKKIEDAGVNMKSIKTELSSKVLEGKTFVITGTLSLKRTEIAKMVTDNGGKVSGSVSKKTDYLIAGDNAGSKLDKANTLGVKVLTEEDFIKMIS